MQPVLPGMQQVLPVDICTANTCYMLHDPMLHDPMLHDPMLHDPMLHDPMLHDHMT